jgi:hypothetical protein
VTGAPGGLVSADAFLQKWTPLIQASPAYKHHGLIIINFDEGGYTLSASQGGGFVIAFEGQTCCSELPGPNLGSFPETDSLGPYTLTFGSYGGDRTGAVLLSNQLKPGTVSKVGFNHFSLLKTLEDNFRTKSYLGYAGQPGLISIFGGAHSDVKTSR